MTKADVLTGKVLAAVHSHFPGVTVWRNNRYEGAAVRSGGRRGWISAGVNGQADVTGVIPPKGRRLEIEVKAGDDQMRVMQHAFKDMIEKAGGIYLVARDVDTLIRELKEAL